VLKSSFHEILTVASKNSHISQVTLVSDIGLYHSGCKHIWLIMTIDRNSSLDKLSQKPATGSDSDENNRLSLEGNPVGQTRDKYPVGQASNNQASLHETSDRLLASMEFVEFAQVLDKKPERRRLLDNQLQVLYANPDPNSRDAGTIKRLTDAFEKDYANFAPGLDNFGNSVHFRADHNATRQDLLTRQDLMDWVNRADQGGRDNNLPRLSRKQQADLDTLEKVRKPEATAKPEIQAKVEDLRKMESTVARLRNNERGFRGHVDSHKRDDLTKDAAVKAYIQEPDKQGKDVIEGVLTNGELHHVHHIVERLAAVERSCKIFKDQQQKPSTNQEYWKADAEKKALLECNSSNSMKEPLVQEQFRALAIRQDLVKLSSQDTYSMRRFRDDAYDGTNKLNPLDDKSKIPKDTDSIINTKLHHVDNPAIRLSKLAQECAKYHQAGKLPSSDPNYWAALAEYNALAEFRGTNNLHEKARALKIKQELLGLEVNETKELRQLRDKL
jgi:hypothetical protein